MNNILGWLALGIVLVFSIFPIISTLDSTGLDFTEEVEGVVIDTFEIDESWENPTEGTVIESTCDNTNGLIAPSSLQTCDYTIEYDVESIDGEPVELRYDAETDDGVGNWEVTVFAPDDTQEGQLEGDVNETTGMTTQQLNFEDVEDIDTIELSYTLEETGGNQNEKPAIYSSQLDYVEEEAERSVGLSESLAFTFIVLLSIGVIGLALWTA